MDMDVGVIGLGTMGSAIAQSLVLSGKSVVGYDIAPDAAERFERNGGVVAPSPGEVAAGAPVVLLSLPSSAALQNVVEDVCEKGSSGTILVECSTLAIADKEAARQRLAARDITLLDCPVSGAGAQALTHGLLVLASGDEAAVDRCRPIFDPISRAAPYLGPFGNGMKMKFVANLLVAIHNASTAEALTMAQNAGLDPHLVHAVISDSAGSSRMFELRGPMMVEDRYEPALITIDLWRKDLDLIGGFAAAVGCKTPLFAQSEALYREAEAMGLGRQDSAAVKRVLDRMADTGSDKT